MGMQEEVGDLFVTDSLMTIKLLPSRKSASKPIRWFENGQVVDHSEAAKDIAGVVGRLIGKNRTVRGLTIMTEKGTQQNLGRTGLLKVVSKAGFTPLN
jgi:hypothetical protein